MRKFATVLVFVAACCGLITTANASDLVNHCETGSEFTLLGDNYGRMMCYEGETGGAVDSGLYLKFYSGSSYDAIARWDKAGAGLNQQVTTSDTLSFYLHSYWNSNYNPVHYNDLGYENSGYRVDIWYAGDTVPITIDGPRSFGNLTSWTFQSFNMPKAGTIVAIDWGVNMNRYKYFYLDEVKLGGRAVAEFSGIPGDANKDGKVDVVDLGILATYYGTRGTADWAIGDFNNDANVDILDLGILATNWGLGCQPVSSPASPKTYSLPQNAVWVSNGNELAAELAKSTVSDIVLADGFYDRTDPIIFSQPHRLWAEHLGQAVMRCGLAFGGNYGTGGAEIHGLRFDMQDSTRGFQGACVYAWGTGVGLKITDCWFDGHNQLDSAIMMRVVDGSQVRRVVIDNFLSYGIYACDYPNKQDPAVPVIIEDAVITGISRAVPKSSNGTAEAGIWLGNTGRVSRVKVRNCAWMSVWTGSACNDSLLEQMDLDGSPVGVYIENITRRSVFSKFAIGPNVDVGCNSEWNHNDPNLGGDSNIIRDGLIDATDKGVYLDQGTKNTRIERVTIRNAHWGGIGMYLSPTCSYTQCTFDLPAGVPTVRYDHWSTP